MTGEGERQAAVQRRRFWGILAGIGVVGAVTGALYSMHDHGTLDLAALPAPAIVGAVAVLLGAFLYGSWRFFTAVDELEMQDNLWASTAGLYVYSVLFPTWWVLGHLKVAPEPQDWTIFATTLIASMIAYFWRKWRNR